jgi:cobalt-zinc-cadmium efflux system outer membrane protein
MSTIIAPGKPQTVRLAPAHARRIGAVLACLGSALGPPGWARAEDGRERRVAQAPAHAMSSHHATEPAGAALPSAMPDPMSAPATPRTPSPEGGPAALPGLADFERLALARNPTLRQAAAQVEASRSRSFQAGLYPNPTVGYLQEQIGAFGEVRPTTNGIDASRKSTPGELVGGFVQQEVVTGGKLRLSRAKYAEEATAARFQADAQRLRVLNGVRTRYFEVVAAERLIAINRDLSRLNDDAVRTTEELVNVGQANEPDLLQAKVEARRARVALRNAENRHRGSWEGLVSVVGAPELRPTHLDGRALEIPALPLDFDTTLANLLSCSPEIQAVLAEIRRSQVMVRRERAEPIPNVTIQAVVGRNYEFNITTAGVQASIPLPVWNRNQGTIREAQSDLARDYAEHDRLVLSLRHRLADAATRYEDARQSVDDFRTASLPLARRAYEVQSESFRERRSAYPQVLVAERTYVSLNQEYVQSLLELRRAEIEIGGMLLVDGLAPPEAPLTQGHIESVPQPR